MKRGDLVKVLDCTNDGAKFKYGEICKVIVDDGYSPSLESIESGERWWVSYTNMKLLNHQERLNYKYGVKND